MSSVEETKSEQTPEKPSYEDSLPGNSDSFSVIDMKSSRDSETGPEVEDIKTSIPDNSGKETSLQEKELTQKSEWDLLTNRIKAWWEGTGLSVNGNQVARVGLYLGCFVALILLLQIYGKVLDTIAIFPLAPRLFELVGIIWLIKFSISNLARKEDRQKVVTQLKKRWFTFLGKPLDDD